MRHRLAAGLAVLSILGAAATAHAASDPTPSDPCCAPQPTAGCGDAAVEKVVCGADKTCCTTQWGDGCVSYAGKAGFCEPLDAKGPCAVVHDTPGCDDPAIEAAVCGKAPACCSSKGSWTLTCVAYAKMFGATGGGGGDDDEPGCATPTAAQCLDPDYLATDCGQEAVAAANGDPDHVCSVAVADAVADGEATNPTAVVHSADRLWDAWDNWSVPSEPIVTATVQTAETPAGLGSAGFWGYDAATMAFVAGLAELNGPAVTSCDEYVWDAFYDFHMFELATIDPELTAREVFDIAFGPTWQASSVAMNALYGHPLRDAAGAESPVALLDFGGVAPKNDYYDLGELRTVLEQRWDDPAWPNYDSMGQPINPIALMQAGFDEAAPHDVVWHWLMSELYLAGELDETLDALHARQKAFRPIRDDAKRTWGRYQLMLGICENQQTVADLQAQFGPRQDPQLAVELGFDGADVDCSPSHLQALRNVAEAKLERVVEALLQAHEDGCFAAGPNPCDWSPQRFVEAMQGQLVSARHRAHTECLEATAGTTFEQLASYEFPPVDGSGPAFYPTTDFTASPAMLRGFTGIRDAWVEALVEYLSDELGVDAGDGGAVKLAQSYSDRWDSSNSWFGATCHAATSWQVSDLDQNALCNVNAGFEGHFDASVQYGDEEAEVVAVDLSVDGLESGVYAYRVYGMDQAVGDDWDAGYEGTHNLFAISEGTDALHVSAESTPVPILGVPISVEAGMAGRAGITARGDLTLHSACDSDFGLEVGAAFEPWLNIEGFLEVGIDYGVVEVGVKGELTLLDARLPATVSVKAGAPYGNLKNLRLDVVAGATLELEWLAGRLALYGELLGARAEKTLVRWRGIPQEFRLFEAELGLPLDLVAAACASPLLDCGE